MRRKFHFKERRNKMKAFVDENVCISCGLCEGVCPDIFSLD
ncbi:ferredoxin, partial [uncultured Clostridium sp.]